MAWRWFLLLHIFAIGIIEGLNPFWPIWLGKHLPSDSWSYGLVLAAIYGLPILGTAVSATYWGIFSDKIGAKINWLRSMLGLALAFILLGWVTSLSALLLTRAVQGLFGSVMPASQHLALALNFKQGLFKLQSATALASILGPIFLGGIMQWISFEWCLSLAGMIILIFSFLSHWLITVEQKTHQTKKDHSQTLRLNIPFLCFSLLPMARWVVVPVLASLSQDLASSAWKLAMVYSALPLGMLVAKYFWLKKEGEHQASYYLFCVIIAALLSTLHLVVDEIVFITTIRFMLGLVLAPLMPWSQLQFLVDKISKDIKSSKGLLLGRIQRQQRLGMALGLMLGSGLTSLPMVAFGISVILYFLIASLFYSLNRNDPAVRSNV